MSHQVDKMIQDEYEKFINSKYSGKLPIPENALDMFKRGILAMPPTTHRINFNKIKSIGGKSKEQLTNGDIQDIIKIILNTSIEKSYPEVSFDDAIKEYIKVEKFIIEYNLIVDNLQKELVLKRQKLQELSPVPRLHIAQA